MPVAKPLQSTPGRRKVCMRLACEFAYRAADVWADCKSGGSAVQDRCAYAGPDAGRMQSMWLDHKIDAKLCDPYANRGAAGAEFTMAARNFAPTRHCAQADGKMAAPRVQDRCESAGLGGEADANPRARNAKPMQVSGTAELHRSCIECELSASLRCACANRVRVRSVSMQDRGEAGGCLCEIDAGPACTVQATACVRDRRHAGPHAQPTYQ